MKKKRKRSTGDAPARFSDGPIDDEKLSLALLCGYSKGGIGEWFYLDHPDEIREARRALARLLASEQPLPRLHRNLLAVMFDPDSIATPMPVDGHTLMVMYARHQELLIRFRGRAPRSQLMRNLYMARDVAIHRTKGKSVEEAVAEVEEAYGASDSTVKRAMRSAKKALSPRGR